MRFTRVAILAVALGAGLVAAMLARNLTQPEPTEAVDIAAPPPVQTTDVLVAAKTVPTGTVVDAAALEWRAWPKESVGSTFITRDARPDAATELAGMVARAQVFAGEPISEEKLIRTDRGFLSAILPAGKRAVATAISADTSAGGFILPNDRVDVIMTRSNGEGDEAHFVTETILNNVRVLAIDQTIDEKDGDKVVVGQTATLELTPEQAEILTVAQQMAARLTLALRSVADGESDPFAENRDAVHLIRGKGKGTVTIVRNGVVKEQETMK